MRIFRNNWLYFRFVWGFGVLLFCTGGIIKLLEVKVDFLSFKFLIWVIFLNYSERRRREGCRFGE